ncbi:hypothetical protein ACFPJ4_07880 [Lysinimonas soli]|uniref:MetS family NSS transporter small subunit n=1 Tax=Lysinimonas soli TaxID=1074233 RepID=A0ABW0NPD6_9MICO
MIYLLALLSLALWAISATIVTVRRDGHRRMPFDPAYNSRSA